MQYRWSFCFSLLPKAIMNEPLPKNWWLWNYPQNIQPKKSLIRLTRIPHLKLTNRPSIKWPCSSFVCGQHQWPCTVLPCVACKIQKDVVPQGQWCSGNHGKTASIDEAHWIDKIHPNIQNNVLLGFILVMMLLHAEHDRIQGASACALTYRMAFPTVEPSVDSRGVRDWVFNANGW